MNQAFQFPPNARVTVAPGVTLNCQQWGPRDSSDAPIVFCHGLLFGSLAAWYFSVALPLSSTHEVVLYDMRGHGRSDVAVDGYDIATQVDDLEKVIAHSVGDTRESKPVTLVGHSYGAMIALAFALRHPERVAKLVLVDAPHPLSEHVRPGLEAVKSRDELLRRFHAHIGGEGRRAGKLRERLAYLLFESTLCRDIRRSTDFPREELAALTVPTLCIYGLHSECRDAGIALARTLRNAEIAFVDCGHYITDDAPAEMLAHIEHFLRS